jgi:6-phosphogluconate dehydrogenase
MKFGIVGLGRIGANLARRGLELGHQVVGFNRSPEKTRAVQREGLDAAMSIEELAAQLRPPRIVLIYVMHGEATEQMCRALRAVLEEGDIVVDGGNSHWADSRRRHGFFAERAVRFLDVGTSGGVSGARNGACFMAGGDRDAYDIIEPILRDLAVDAEGTVFVGGPGSGHFVKLIHNAIEFGMVQAIAEGVELLARSDYELNLPALFNNWQHGSVIRSWLMELTGKALQEHGDLSTLSTYVEDTGEVKWILEWALEQDIPIPVVSTSQTALMHYRDVGSVAAKAVALLRNQFGEHPLHRPPPRDG